MIGEKASFSDDEKVAKFRTFGKIFDKIFDKIRTL